MFCRPLCLCLVLGVLVGVSDAQERPFQPKLLQAATPQNEGQETAGQETTGQETAGQEKNALQEAGLSEAIEQYVAAYNAGDVDRVMSFWDEHADFVDIRGRFHEGRDLIGALFRRGFAENPGRQLRLESAARKFLTPQVAMDDGVLQLTRADGGVDRGRYTVVWTKADGNWRIRSARDIPIAVEEPAAEAEQAPLEELAWLIGKWESNSDEMSVTFQCDWTLDKQYLIQNFEIQVPSSDQKMRVVTYITFDPAEACFRSWFFDNRGGFGSGTWTRDEDQFRVATLLALPDGQLGSLLMTWQQVDDNTIRWQGTEREAGGEALPDIELTYARVQ